MPFGTDALSSQVVRRQVSTNPRMWRKVAASAFPPALVLPAPTSVRLAPSRSRRAVALVAPPAVLAALVSLPLDTATAAPSTTLVLTEVYGGGGNSGATLKNDFIEIKNIGTTTVNVS